MNSPWRGRRVLITAGPTREYLDPIRYLTNASSGLMAYALARAARDRGARVTVVSGPCQVGSSWRIGVVPVVTARQMHRAVLTRLKDSDVVIAAAAVGDWRFERTSRAKVKKTGGPLHIALSPNPDIIADVARRLGRFHGDRRRPDGRVLVGFALETSRPLARAREKLRCKGLDLIVANRIESVGLNDTRVSILDRRGRVRRLPKMSKPRAAAEILAHVERYLP